MAESQSDDSRSLDIRLSGADVLVIKKRYETLSIVNDFLIGVLFLIGSVFFFYASTENAGVWLFVIGSAQLLIRPTIRLAHNVHLQKIGGDGWNM